MGDQICWCSTHLVFLAHWFDRLSAEIAEKDFRLTYLEPTTKAIVNSISHHPSGTRNVSKHFQYWIQILLRRYGGKVHFLESHLPVSVLHTWCKQQQRSQVFSLRVQTSLCQLPSAYIFGHGVSGLVFFLVQSREQVLEIWNCPTPSLSRKQSEDETFKSSFIHAGTVAPLSRDHLLYG